MRPSIKGALIMLAVLAVAGLAGTFAFVKATGLSARATPGPIESSVDKENGMTRKLTVGAALLATLVLPVIARAHGTHVHKVMGTVSSIDGNHISVKTTDGKNVMVILDAKTKVTQGTTKVTPTAVKAGVRIVAEGTEKDGTVTAATVKIGTAPVSGAR